MGPAVLRVLLVSIWTWAPLLSAVLQTKLVPQLPPDFAGQAQQNEPRKGSVLQRKLQPVMPPGARVNHYPAFGQNPGDMMKFYQFWQWYLENIHKNDQRGAQSPGFPTSWSPYRWQPRERPSQQESPGAQNSQRTPGGVGSGGGCPYCRRVHPTQPTRTNHEQHPLRSQPWWFQQVSQDAPVGNQDSVLQRKLQHPKLPYASQHWGLHQTEQKPGQPTSSPSNAREAGPLSSNAYLFKPQGSQHGSGTGGPQQGVHQSSYMNSGYQRRYQDQSSQDGQSEGKFLSQDSTLQDMETPERQKPNTGYQAGGSRGPGQGQVNKPNSGWQSSYSSGRQVGYGQSSNKPSNPEQSGYSGQQMPYNQPKKPYLPTKSSTMPMPPPGYYLQPNIASQSYPSSNHQNEEKPSQWLSVRPPKQAMSPKQSEKPPGGGSAKFYYLPSRLIEQNALSKKDSQDEKPPRNSAFWHRQQGFSRPQEQGYGPDDERPITVPPLGSDVVVSSAVFSRGPQNVGFAQNSRFSQTNEKQEGSLSRAPAAYIYKHPYILPQHFQQKRHLQ